MRFMTAMQIDAPGRPLRRVQRPVPTPGRNELLIRVSACGVCRTDLHVLDGEIAASRSEEHTSELPSLMRISYAVFDLNKKTTNERHKRQYRSPQSTNII